MSDWQVGDLAVCVNAGPSRFCDDRRPQLVEGRAYRVLALGAGDYAGHVPYSLILSGTQAKYQAHGFGFDPDRFRKIRPDEHEACEPEFVTLLKRIKQTESA